MQRFSRPLTTFPSDYIPILYFYYILAGREYKVGPAGDGLARPVIEYSVTGPGWLEPMPDGGGGGSKLRFPQRRRGSRGPRRFTEPESAPAALAGKSVPRPSHIYVVAPVCVCRLF